jgi:protein phosphatase
MALALRYAARSDVGMIREINEDSGYAGPRLLVVADGVGGHAAGEVASSVAVATVSQLDEDSPGGDLLDRLSAAVTSANTHLRDMITGDPDLEGMGTTLTAMLRAGSRFGLVHVGDSRCYLLRDGALQQITRDHTFVQGLLDDGRITADEADQHPQRNLITNAVDGREGMDLDLSVREARAGDRYLLCSDGLSGVVSEDTLQETLAEANDPSDAADQLIRLALRGGGPDNITAVVADVVEVESVPSAVPVVVGAAAEGVVRRTAPSDSAAARAAALAKREEEDAADEVEDEHPVRRWARRVVVLAVLGGILGATGYGVYQWSQDQYYVAADGEQVAIYQGLPQDIGPISTSKLYSTEDISLTDLPAYHRERVESQIAANGLSDAERIVDTLRTQARLCQEATAPPTPSPTPSGKGMSSPGSSSPSPSPTPTGSSAQTGTASPDATGTTPGTDSPSTSSAPAASPSPGATTAEQLQCGGQR